ncbi:MAG TPA: L-threonylcarbamoyladenylate synthase [Bacteroidales bacterium]|nr:L-threonylcarbamoyladenylate synthase [Bacteroidales bacterium]
MNHTLEIQRAAEMIAAGELVAFPTETVYGLGANAFDPTAVAKIFEIKQRPSFDPLIVHISEISQLENLCRGRDERVYKLAGKFWPGPLTLVLPKQDSVPEIVTSGLETVAVRMPANPIARELIRQAGTPIAAPSANKFGMISPTEAAHVKKQFPEVYTIDGGKTQVGIESTVMTLHEDGFEVLRPGVITADDLRTILPESSRKGEKEQHSSPGLLKSHYSPGKPMYIAANPCSDFKEQDKGGLIAFGIPGKNCRFAKIEVLSESKDLKEAAVNLFSAMHRMDEADVEYIVAEPVPEEGVGIAIMNRLKKASYRS